MDNPLAEDAPTDSTDQGLVMRARSGERRALEELVQRHQPWIYNIARRMLFHPQDAEDATQEILIKGLTRLASFEGRSSFRTWLYRIAVNHLLNTRRSRVEDPSLSFRRYGDGLDDTPDLDFPDPKAASPDANLLVTEAMMACTWGMLLCLDREQRMSYILGAIFEVTDTVAAEVMEITAANFRQRLARARRDLGNFMDGKCGLVNAANPCRCAKKTRGFIEAGHVNPDNLLFSGDRVCEVREAAPRMFATIRALDGRCAEIYRAQPFYKSPDLSRMVREIVESSELKSALEP